MKSYIFGDHHMRGGRHVFCFSSLGEEHVKFLLSGEGKPPVPTSELSFKRISDFPPVLIELEDGKIVNIEKFQGKEWMLEKMRLHERKN